jgi:hypothetical protein
MGFFDIFKRKTLSPAGAAELLGSRIWQVSYGSANALLQVAVERGFRTVEPREILQQLTVEFASLLLYLIDRVPNMPGRVFGNCAFCIERHFSPSQAMSADSLELKRFWERRNEYAAMKSPLDRVFLNFSGKIAVILHAPSNTYERLCSNRLRSSIDQLDFKRVLEGVNWNLREGLTVTLANVQSSIQHNEVLNRQASAAIADIESTFSTAQLLARASSSPGPRPADQKDDDPKNP